MKCKATTAKNEPCKANALKDGYCNIHYRQYFGKDAAEKPEEPKVEEIPEVVPEVSKVEEIELLRFLIQNPQDLYKIYPDEGTLILDVHKKEFVVCSEKGIHMLTQKGIEHIWKVDGKK